MSSAENFTQNAKHLSILPSSLKVNVTAIITFFLSTDAENVKLSNEGKKFRVGKIIQCC